MQKKPCEDFLFNAPHFYGMESGKADGVLEFAERSLNAPTFVVKGFKVVRSEGIRRKVENAIEACFKMEQENRYMRLYSYAKGEMFFIEIENSFTGERAAIDKNTGLPQSTKSHDGLHGMGIANIQRCARKYFGDIDLQISQDGNNGKFNLTVMLQSKA